MHRLANYLSGRIDLDCFGNNSCHKSLTCTAKPSCLVVQNTAAGNYSSIRSKVLNNSDCTDKGAVVREVLSGTESYPDV